MESYSSPCMIRLLLSPPVFSFYHCFRVACIFNCFFSKWFGWKYWNTLIAQGGRCRIISQLNIDKTTGEHEVLYWIINWMLNLVWPRKLIVPLEGMKTVLDICHFLPLCNYCVQNIHSLLSFPWEFSVLDVYVEPWKPSRIHHENTKTMWTM